MLELFKSRTRYIQGIRSPGKTDYIQRVYQERLLVLRQYYRERSFYIQNNHLLVRLLTTGLGSLHTDYQTFVDTASHRSAVLMRHFQLTNSVSFGKIHEGTFYGEGSYEIIIGDDGDFDVLDTVKRWKDIDPVRVMTHAISDFNLTLPNGKNNHFVDGLAVIYVNIPQLLLQYRLFIEEQMTKPDDQQITSPKLFLYRYVLPNMMSSHMDHVLLNRLINLGIGAPMTEGLTKSAFFQAEAGNNDHSGIIKAIDDSLRQVLDKITTTRMDYSNFLSHIFSIQAENALELLTWPDMAPTRQVWWALLLSRLKHLRFMLSSTNSRFAGQNRGDTNDIIYDYSRLLDSHVLESVLPGYLLESVIFDINDVLKLARA